MNQKKQTKILAPFGFAVSKQLGMKNGFTLFVEDEAEPFNPRKITERYWYFNDKFDYLESSQLAPESLGRQRQIKCAKSNKGKGLPPSKLSRYFSLDRGFYSFTDAFEDFLIDFSDFDIDRMNSLHRKTREHDIKYLRRSETIAGCGEPTIHSYVPGISQKEARYFSFYLTHIDLIQCYYKNKK